MKATITLDEKELKEAVTEYLRKRGWNASNVTFDHYGGDQRDPAYVRASAAVTQVPASWSGDK